MYRSLPMLVKPNHRLNRLPVGMIDQTTHSEARAKTSFPICDSGKTCYGGRAGRIMQWVIGFHFCIHPAGRPKSEFAERPPAARPSSGFAARGVTLGRVAFGWPAWRIGRTSAVSDGRRAVRQSAIVEKPAAGVPGEVVGEEAEIDVLIFANTFEAGGPGVGILTLTDNSGFFDIAPSLWTPKS